MRKEGRRTTAEAKDAKNGLKREKEGQRIPKTGRFDETKTKNDSTSQRRREWTKETEWTAETKD